MNQTGGGKELGGSCFPVKGGFFIRRGWECGQGSMRPSCLHSQDHLLRIRTHSAAYSSRAPTAMSHAMLGQRVRDFAGEGRLCCSTKRRVVLKWVSRDGDEWKPEKRSGTAA